VARAEKLPGAGSNLHLVPEVLLLHSKRCIEQQGPGGLEKLSLSLVVLQVSIDIGDQFA
jgi:hypothetical protein